MSRERDPDFELWVAEARAGSFAMAMQLCGFAPRKGSDKGNDIAGPCPACGGRDRFAVHLVKRKFNCRHCEAKGGDALALALVGEHVAFVDACEKLSGRERPQRVAAETADERAQRQARREALDQRIATDQAEREREQECYREREREACRRIWSMGRPAYHGERLGRYWACRGLLPFTTALIREADDIAFFHGDELDGTGRRQPRVVYRGPAQLAAMLDNDGAMVGLHITHLRPDWSGKAEIVDPETGELLNPKKMRGSKKGSHIVLRQPAPEILAAARRDGLPVRLFMGEGIETAGQVGTSLKHARRLLPSDIFWSSGDLGNLGGDAVGTIAHPTLKTPKGRPQRLPSAEPDLGAPAILIPAEVTHLCLLGDGDSEPFLTRTTLERARARYARPGLEIAIAMAPEGEDFNSLARAG
ncbi:MAG: hypothetical protein K2X84_09145 [Beijerinckiaceae bacterium]|nr:hypothetical protein [Beijerinckiaceae bacterium]